MGACFKYLVILIGLCSDLSAFAGAFQISPLRVELSAKTPIAVVTVRNDGATAGVMKLDVMAWSQNEGQDIYSPTADVIATPPVFIIPPGGSQIVRLGLRSKADVSKELSYRLYLHEQPDAKEESGAMKVALRFGIPIFVAAVTKTTKPILSWRVDAESNRVWRVSATNAGDSHVQTLGTTFTSDGETKQIAQIKGMSYILPGQTRSWIVTPDITDMAIKKIKVLSQTDVGDQNSVVELSK